MIGKKRETAMSLELGEGTNWNDGVLSVQLLKVRLGSRTLNYDQSWGIWELKSDRFGGHQIFSFLS